MSTETEQSAEQIRDRVAGLVRCAGIIMETQQIPERTDQEPGKWDKCAGHFRIWFKPQNDTIRGEPVRIEYSMGAGHRVWSGKLWGWRDIPGLKGKPKPGTRIPIHLCSNPRIVDMSRFPAPHIADVLYSIVLDSSACDMSFSQWCDEYGYDTDSIKARRVWVQCVEIGHDMRSLLRSVWDQLVEALQDY